MKYTIALPTGDMNSPAEFLTATAVAQISEAIEDSGFDACHVTDHPFPPSTWVRSGGHQALDPLVTLAVAASSTTRLRLLTNMFIPAYRNPFIAAKAVATVDVLSEGRLILGLAVGYLEGEFAALGANFAQRGDLFDAAVAAMKQAWTGQDVHAGGQGWSARGNAMLPRPATQPHPPIWIGGNTAAARRRAVVSGQGWCPFPAASGLASATRTAELNTIADLGTAIAGMNSYAETLGHPLPQDICVPAFSHPHGHHDYDPAVLRDEVANLEDLGVTWLVVHLTAPTRTEFIAAVRRYSDQVIQPAPSK
jgi:probable F420-dependent oxidoreductase